MLRRARGTPQLWGLRLATALSTMLAVSSVVLVAVRPAEATPTAAWPVFTVNAFGATVTDLGPGGTSTTLGVASDPNDIATTPDGNYAYVSSSLGVSVIDGADTATPTALSRPLLQGTDCESVAISPDGNYAYVVTGPYSEVTVISGADSADPTVLPVLLQTVGGAATVQFTPSGQYAYVANWHAGTVSIIDGANTATPTVSSTVLTVGTNPISIAMTPDGQYAYVYNEGSGTVSVIDNADSADPTVSSDTLAVPYAPASGQDPGDLAITPDGQRVYLTNWYGGTVTEIDGADSPSPTVSPTSLTVGEAPSAVAITPDGQTAYVTNAVSDSVTVIENADSSAPSVTSTIPDIQSRPIAVAVDPVDVSDLNDPQTVTFTTTPPLSMYPGGANFVTSASSSSGLPVTLSIDPSSTDVCEIGGTTVSALTVGTCVIDANQPGDLEYAPSPQVQQTISVTTEQRQTVSFGSPGPGSTAVGGPSYSPTATASSGLLASISLDQSSTGCTLNEGAVEFTAIGTCVLDANQPGNAQYAAAPEVQESVDVFGHAQTIAFNSQAPSTAAIGGPSFTPTATASSGLPVTVSLAAGSQGCVLSEGVVTFTSAGTCLIAANQSGNSQYSPAPQAMQSIVSGPAPPSPVTSPSTSHGYWLVGSDGGIFSFGSAQFYGSMGGMALQRPVVGIVATRDRGGYWLDASDGGVFSFGDTQFYGSIPALGIHPYGSSEPDSLDAPIVGMVPSADDGGYFMVGADGGVFAFGDAKFEGSCPGIGGCSGAAVAVMPDASGNGYWVVTATGHVYAFGDAPNYGEPGSQSVPVTSAVRSANGMGYMILFANGAVAAYGSTPYDGCPLPGSYGGLDPATAIFTTADGSGYWVATADGSVTGCGEPPEGPAPNDGSMAGKNLDGSIIAASGS
jgi:YVTN family beta-propeller protein